MVAAGRSRNDQAREPDRSSDAGRGRRAARHGGGARSGRDRSLLDQQGLLRAAVERLGSVRPADRPRLRRRRDVPRRRESFRMQATTLGQYLLYGEDRDFLATGLLGSVQLGGESERRDRVEGRRGLRCIRASQRRHGPAAAADRHRRAGARLGRPVGCVDPLRLRRHRRLPGLPRGRAERDRDTRGRRLSLRRGHRPRRHAQPRQRLRVPRGPRPLRPTLEPLRRSDAPGRLPRPLPERIGGDPREPLLRQPAADPRSGRLADICGLARIRLADPRADLLPLARARLDGRRAPDGQQPGRERGALPDLPVQEELLQRDGRRPPAGQAHVPAAGLHRRSGGRPRQGLVPDRHQPLRGPPGDQRRQARGRPRDRGVGAVRLYRVPGQAAVHARRHRRGHQGGQGPRGELLLPDPQVRQRVRRDPLRRRRRGDGHQRWAVPAQRSLLAGRALLGRRSRQHDHGRPRRCGGAGDIIAGGLAAYPAADRRPPSIRRGHTATSAA